MSDWRAVRDEFCGAGNMTSPEEDRMAVEIALLRERMTWREGVPRVGEYVLIMVRGRPQPLAGRLIARGFETYGGLVNPYEITHWCRIPRPTPAELPPLPERRKAQPEPTKEEG